MTTPYASMVNGRYTDTRTGRAAYYGPNGEPGYAPAQRPANSQAYTMPDGRVAYYVPGSAGLTSPQYPTVPAPQTGGPAVPQQPVADREAQNRDAYARLSEVLNTYGLGSLGGTIQSWLVEGISEAEVVQRMRDTPEFKTRFPAIEERRRKGLAPISPGEYVAYERNTRQMMRAAGLPEGFYDSPDDFTRFLTNDLSPAELGDRITMAADAAYKAPKETRDALAAWGVGPGDLAAFWIDPDKTLPMLERKWAAAQLAGTATRTSFGTLTEQTASEFAGLGVTAQQAETGFSTLANSRELFQSLDSTEDTIDQGTQLGAAFGGNANAQRRIEQRKRKREATFEGGGGYASSQQGLVGLGDTE